MDVYNYNYNPWCLNYVVSNIPESKFTLVVTNEDPVASGDFYFDADKYDPKNYRMTFDKTGSTCDLKWTIDNGDWARGISMAGVKLSIAEFQAVQRRGWGHIRIECLYPDTCQCGAVVTMEIDPRF